MLNGDKNTIIFPPFGGLSDEVTLLLPFLCLCIERLVVVRVDVEGISDGLGRDGDVDCCVGDGGCHLLSYSRGDNPEDIRSDDRSRFVYVSIDLISL